MSQETPPAEAAAQAEAAAATATADPAATRIVAELAHGSPLIACRFDPTGRFVFATAQDNQVLRWDLESGALAPPLAFHESWVHALGFSPQGETLYTAGCDGRLAWWPVAESPAPARTIDAHQGFVRSLAVSPDGSLIATSGNDKLVKVWNSADGSLVREFAGHDRPVYSTLFVCDGHTLLSGDLAGTIRQWDLESGSQARQFDAAPLHSYNEGQGVDYGGVRSLSVSHDGTLLAAAGLHNAENPLGAVNEPLVLAFAWETGALVQSHATQEKLKGVAWRAVYHPQGFLVGASGGSGGGYLLFWKPDQAEEIAKLALPNTARDLDLHPDGLRLATAHFDGKLRVSIMQSAPA